MITIFDPDMSMWWENDKLNKTVGLGTLCPTSCIVTAEHMGEYRLEMHHPRDIDGKYKRIALQRVMMIPVGDSLQPFRITHIRSDHDDITVYADHIFYDLLEYWIPPMELTGTYVDIYSQLLSNGYIPPEFSIIPPYPYSTEIKTFKITKPINLVQFLLSDDPNTDSLHSVFGVEIERDGFYINLTEPKTEPSGFVIKYGKNMRSMTVDTDISGVKTEIKVTGKDGSKTVLSPDADKYIPPRKTEIYDTSKTVAELEKEAQEQFNAGLDKPRVNIKADIVALSQTEEYKDLNLSIPIKLGDIVEAYDTEMGIDLSAKFIAKKEDCLTGELLNVEFGDFLPTLGGSVTTGIRGENIATSAVVNSGAVYRALQAHENRRDNPHKVTTKQAADASKPPKEGV